MAATLKAESAKFWTLCRIEPGTQGPGYQNQTVPLAQDFLQKQPVSPLVPGAAQTLASELLTTFRQDESAELLTRSHAGLCLRCWVSHPILKACMKLANLFGSAGQFTYRDLLPFVLTDDGQQQVVPEVTNNGYCVIQAPDTPATDKSETDKPAPLSYIPFSLTVLKTYQLSPGKRLSLVNWTYLQTKQHPELINFLAEFGFQKLSDWALLNRVRLRQLEQLSERDRTLVSAFHAVYRRDRRLNARTGRCLNPTDAQLTEINNEISSKINSDEINLFTQSAPISNSALLYALKQIATQLRQFDVWQSREPLEHFDAAAGQYQPRSDLPSTTLDTDTSAESDLLATLHHQLAIALQESLNQSLTARIVKLKKSKKYAPFADKFVVGLQHYYREGCSLKEITPLLGTSSWNQTRRILNPGDFLNRVRSLTLQHFLDKVIIIVQQQDLAPWPPSPDYLQQLSQQLEAFADSEIFRAAVTEMKAGSHRNFDSPYAQMLLQTLDTTQLTTHPSGCR